MKWSLKVSLKYLTPSSALRGSWLKSPLCISASPTSLFLSAGPRFPFPSTVRSNLSALSSSYRNQDVDPSKSGGIFVVIPLSAVHGSVDSARYAPTKDSQSVYIFCFEVIKIFLTVTHHWHCWNSQTIRTHTGPCARQDPLLLCHSTTALRYHFVVVDLFFL